jgi:GDP-mannose 6-dehydrogenase
MNISVFGLGYVGCVSIGCLAQNGHTIIGVDVNESKVNLINCGRPTIIEKDIDHIIKSQYDNWRIRATTDFIEAVKNTEVSFICVGTPSLETGQLNLEFVYNTARQIAEGLKKSEHFHVVAIRSTVFPGTNEKVTEIIEEYSGKKRNRDFAVVSNPEFLREGSAVKITIILH